jgi:ABC-type dipeptide/oligopeptide/nickel transport system ATPase component
VEEGPTGDVFASPKHPYTELLASAPDLGSALLARGVDLDQISPPSLV